MDNQLYTLMLQDRSYCIPASAADLVTEAQRQEVPYVDIQALCADCDERYHSVRICVRDVVSLIGHKMTADMALKSALPGADNVISIWR